MDELSDRAWARMQDLLDEELPVERESERKPIFWWTWAAAVLALLLIGAFVLYLPSTRTVDRNVALVPGQQPSEILEPQAPAPSGESLLNSTTATAETETSRALVAEEVAANNEAASHEADEGAAANVPQIVARQRVSPTTTELKTKQKEANSRTTNNNQLLATRPHSAAESAAEPGTFKNGEADPSMSVASIPLAEERPAAVEITDREAIIIAAIDGLETTELVLPPQSFDPQQSYHPKKSALLPLEANLGLVMRQAGQLNGAFTEVRTGLRLGRTGKWALQTGAGAHLQAQPFRIDYQNNEQALAAKADAAQDPNAGFAGNSNQYDLATSVASNEIHLRTLYADLPLLVEYRLGKRWGIEGGTRFSYRLSSYWDQGNQPESSLSGNNSGSLSLTSNRNNYVYQPTGSSQTTTFVLNDLFASATMGISYRPAPALLLRLQYQHSVTNLLHSQIYQTTQRAAWLSVGLRF